MSTPTVKERVAAGIAVLDQVQPEWRSHIDLAAFDITSPRHCILGQVFGEYSRGMNQLWPELGELDDPSWWDEWERLYLEHGFHTNFQHGSPTQTDLQQAWKEALS